MNDVIKQLLAVQERDLRISNLRKQINSVPAEKDKVKGELSSAEEKVQIAKDAVLAVEKSIHSLDVDISSTQEKIADLQKKSFDVKKNEEYRALVSEIEAAKGRIRGFEDRQLEFMEQVEATKQGRVDADKEYQAAQARIDAVIKDLELRERNCREQLEKEQQVRSGLCEDIPQDSMRLYERLIAQAGDGAFRKVVVEIQDGGCGSCYLKIIPNIINKAKKGEMVCCENCGAILYF